MSVYFALTEEAMHEAIAIVRQNGGTIWIPAEMLPAEDYNEIVASGVRISRFIHHINRKDKIAVEAAIHVLQEQHPGETIWCQI